MFYCTHLYCSEQVPLRWKCTVQYRDGLHYATDRGTQQRGVELSLPDIAACVSQNYIQDCDDHSVSSYAVTCHILWGSTLLRMSYMLDGELVESLGLMVSHCPGRAAAVEAPAAPSLPYRVGHGFDLHRLEEGYKLIIGGVDIPHTKGCVAHSDGACYQ